MVSPTINRKRGKTREQRRRDLGRMKKKNAKEAGNLRAKHKLAVTDIKPSAKAIKKKAQRLKLLKRSKGDTSGGMQIG
jgi:hypothetical protein